MNYWQLRGKFDYIREVIFCTFEVQMTWQIRWGLANMVGRCSTLWHASLFAFKCIWFCTSKWRVRPLKTFMPHMRAKSTRTFRSQDFLRVKVGRMGENPAHITSLLFLRRKSLEPKRLRITRGGTYNRIYLPHATHLEWCSRKTSTNPGINQPMRSLHFPWMVDVLCN